MSKHAGMIIRLSHSQWETAARHAKLVQDKSQADQRVPYANMAEQFDEDEILQKTIMGYAGEIAAALFFDVRWTPMVDNFKDKPDIPGWEVRTTASRKYPGLIIRKNDPRDRPYILLQKRDNRTFRVAGWMTGQEVEDGGIFTDFGHNNRPAVHYMKPEWLHHTFPQEGA